MLTVIILGGYMILAPLAALIVRHVSRRADAFEQVRFSPWLANFEEYSRHATQEGFRPIQPDEDRTVYIRFIEKQREVNASRSRRRAAVARIWTHLNEKHGYK